MAGSVGGQWLALQGVALARMAVRYSSRYGMREGLARAFDGAHPCKMCHEIRRQRSQRPDPQRTAVVPARHDFFFVSAHALPTRASFAAALRYPPAPGAVGVRHPLKPAVPPPETIS
jgi:hypothetical protein